MKTKSRPSNMMSLPAAKWTQYDRHHNLIYVRNDEPATFVSGSETITYGEGPKKAVTGNCVWKPCVHTKVNSRTVDPTIVKMEYYDSYYREYTVRETYPYTGGAGTLTPPDGSYDDSVVANVLGQVDLNTSDSVLLYSGILQAVPLVGGAFRLTSLLNRAAKKFAKSFRNRPFTTVVKAMISADFIDRFVISPTIDDARKFADATNYVLRVIETAKNRTATPTALSARAVKTKTDRRSSSYVHGSGGYLSYKQHERAFIESKAFAYLDVRYDVSAIDPVRFWANRVGLTRPLDSVWDLVPFSFVIDYFTRAGDFISTLGDKVSSMDGLVGKVGKIHGFWGSLKRSAETHQIHTGFEADRLPSMGDPISMNVSHLGSSSCESSYYTRFPISDPFTWLSRLEKNSGFISLNLSPVRARTIVELFIQAKL